MGYSYDDFLKQAKQAGLLGEFSQKDLETARINPEFGLGILRLKQDVHNATTAEQRVLANAAANQLRQSYGGYTGGADGSGSQPVGASFDGGDAYQKLLQQVAQPGSFQYDPETDPSYRAYRQQYAGNGKRAAADALAAASAATGGIPSSYAVTAAAQAANQYADGLSGVIPELESNAYQRYLAEQEAKRAALSVLEEAGVNASKTPVITSGSGSSSGSGGKVGDVMTQDEMRTLIQQMAAPAVIQNPTLPKVYGPGRNTIPVASGKLKQTAVDVGETQSSAADTGSEWASGVAESQFQQVQSSFASLIGQGKLDDALTYMDQWADKLSEAQYNEIVKILKEAGYV